MENNQNLQNNSKPKGKARNFNKRIQPLVEYFKNCEDKTKGIGAIKQLEKHGYLINELRRDYRLGYFQKKLNCLNIWV